MVPEDPNATPTPAPAPAPHYDFQKLIDDLRGVIGKGNLTSRDILSATLTFMKDCMLVAEQVGGAGVDKKAAVIAALNFVISDIVDPALLHGPAKLAEPILDRLLHDGADFLVDWLADHVLFTPKA